MTNICKLGFLFGNTICLQDIVNFPLWNSVKQYWEANKGLALFLTKYSNLIYQLSFFPPLQKHKDKKMIFYTKLMDLV